MKDRRLLEERFQMKKKIVCAGHLCLDITPVFPVGGAVSELLQPGKLLQIGKADFHTGGSVANTGLGMKILGADVTLVGKIGKDGFGEIVESIVQSYGADSRMVISQDEGTSYTIVLAIPGIDRIFLHYPGPNDTFRASDIPQDVLEEAALFHFGYPTLMRGMYENDGEELIGMLRRAKEAGCATSLDLAAVDPNSPAGAANWRKILESALPYADFFVPSVEELGYMLDPDRFAYWQKKAAGRDVTEILDVETDIRPLADQCMDLGVKILMIKCGAPGLYYRTGDEETLGTISPRIGLNAGMWSRLEGFQRSFVPRQVLSGTGAGDTTIAAFLTAVLDGYAPDKAFKLAAATGASCVEGYDALSGLKSFEELEKKIKAGWKENGT